MKYVDRCSGNIIEQVGINRYVVVGVKYPTVIKTKHAHFLMPEGELSRENPMNTQVVKVIGPRWVVEIQRANGTMVGADFQFRAQMMAFIKENRGTVEISYVNPGQEMTYIKKALIRKVGT